MSDTTKPGDEAVPPASPAAPGPVPGDSAAASAAAASATAAGPAEAQAGAARADIPFDQLKQIVTHLQKEIDGLTARLEEQKGERLRLLADMDNLRKRTEREKEDTAKYAVTKFAQDIVGVVDNFERAAGAVPAGAAEQDPVLKSFHEGVVLAEREFLSVLSRHGVKRIEAVGQPFNPHQHQAVMEREDASVASGTVLQVFQAGYLIEERCLRPAMVVVSRGGARMPKAAEAAPQPSGQGGQDSRD